MRFLIECGTSGVGYEFKGTFAEAVQEARRSFRFPSGYVIVWKLPENERVAQVWPDGTYWIKDRYRVRYWAETR